MHLLTTSIDRRFDAFEARFDALEERWASSLESVTVKLMAEIAKAESRLEAKLETRIAETKAELIRWMFLFWMGQVAVMVGMIKLLK